MDTSSHPPTPTPPEHRRRRRFIVGGVVVAALVAGAFFWLSGDLNPPRDDTATDPGGPAAPIEDEAADATTETVEVDGVPEALPSTILTADASNVSGSTATRGGSWSALARFESTVSGDEITTHMHRVLGAEDFTHRETSRDDTSAVSIYDSEDGSVITVTVRDADTHRTIGVVRVSP